jgi:hypothetical protein
MNNFCSSRREEALTEKLKTEKLKAEMIFEPPHVGCYEQR